MTRTYITHVAIRFNGQIYSLPAPNRHHDVIRHIVTSTASTDNPITHVDARDDDQGFLDSAGRYLNRRQALRIAQKSGQLRPDRPIYYGKLYSENVW